MTTSTTPSAGQTAPATGPGAVPGSAAKGVLVVGDSSPIGQAIVAEFHDSVVAGVSLPDDCSTAPGAEAAVKAVLDKAGRLDVVVLAAAYMPVGPITGTTDTQWQQALSAILGTAFAVCRAALPVMSPGGSIVAISSVNATLAAPGVPAYAAAKAGLEGLVRQLALEYGPQGIRVNAVSPGFISDETASDATVNAGTASDGIVNDAAAIGSGESIRAQASDPAAGYPLGRIGRPAEVAHAVRFLAEATFVTGVVLPVDGGLSIASPAAFLREDLRSRWLPTANGQPGNQA
jgi:meso-butanediol dehydrogenase/(S,S)-butanediol dehydrogenase/diacetyl reductase